MILHLGVIDLPYHDKEGTTTGQVATWLEDRYNIMEVFYTFYEPKIIDELTDALAGSLDNLLMDAPVPDDLFAAATSTIKQDFSTFLYTGQIETLGIAGVPTRAAVMRRSLRFKAKKAKAARPSFIDTGLYETSFMAWTDEKA